MTAATERLRRLRLYGGSETYEQVYPPWTRQPRHVDDVHQTIRDYLAEHRADDEDPIDHQFLIDSGFQFYMGAVSHNYSIGRLRYTTSAASTGWLLGGEKLPDLHTRGQLRLLCRALRIELRE